MLSRIVLPATLKEVEQLKQTYMEKYLRYYVKHRLSQFTKRLVSLDVVCTDNITRKL